MTGLFKKFFPDDNNEMAEKFAAALPEGKLSMAKLQGHFLDHRESPEQAVMKASAVLDAEQSLKDMSVYEWLRRLNMQKYTAKLVEKFGGSRVSDLRNLDEEKLKACGIE